MLKFQKRRRGGDLLQSSILLSNQLRVHDLSDFTTDKQEVDFGLQLRNGYPQNRVNTVAEATARGYLTHDNTPKTIPVGCYSPNGITQMRYGGVQRALIWDYLVNGETLTFRPSVVQLRVLRQGTYDCGYHSLKNALLLLMCFSLDGSTTKLPFLAAQSSLFYTEYIRTVSKKYLSFNKADEDSIQCGSQNDKLLLEFRQNIIADPYRRLAEWLVRFEKSFLSENDQKNKISDEKKVHGRIQETLSRVVVMGPTKMAFDTVFEYVAEDFVQLILKVEGIASVVEREYLALFARMLAATKSFTDTSEIIRLIRCVQLYNIKNNDTINSFGVCFVGHGGGDAGHYMSLTFHKLNQKQEVLFCDSLNKNNMVEMNSWQLYYWNVLVQSRRLLEMAVRASALDLVRDFHINARNFGPTGQKDIPFFVKHKFEHYVRHIQDLLAFAEKESVLFSTEVIIRANRLWLLYAEKLLLHVSSAIKSGANLTQQYTMLLDEIRVREQKLNKLIKSVTDQKGDGKNNNDDDDFKLFYKPIYQWTDRHTRAVTILQKPFNEVEYEEFVDLVNNKLKLSFPARNIIGHSLQFYIKQYAERNRNDLVKKTQKNISFSGKSFSFMDFAEQFAERL